jgi:hypothetical protein
VQTAVFAAFPPHDGLCGLAVVLTIKQIGCKDPVRILVSHGGEYDDYDLRKQDAI